jgi:hypothetical protein
MKRKAILPAVSAGVDALLNSTPSVINLGIESFTDSILAFGGTTVQFDWRPVAGGNHKLIKILNELNRRAEIDESNEKVIGRMRDSQPFLMDVVPAKSVISELNGKVLLHAGPPIQFSEMTGPMKGSCIGAVLFEGWAATEKEALEQLESGAIQLSLSSCECCRADGRHHIR